MSDPFVDIRPYHDAEVQPTLQRLLQSQELLQGLSRFYFPRWPALGRCFLVPWLRQRLAKELKIIESVHEYQIWQNKVLTPMLEKSTEQVEVRGLEKLSQDQAYLFISNHRDIAMDPLLVNYSLFLAGWPTSRIAIGDNLTKQGFVADIMRLNKSFVVKRNISNRKEKLTELKRLSAYIRHSIDEGHSVWIAQREGRAKDGVDKTDTAVLKMLALHGRDYDEDFSTAMEALKPVPVSIQYEWDPCDRLKAQELVTIAEHGTYQKQEGEDTRSILLGMTGQKGRIVVSFGDPIQGEACHNAEVLAAAIDQQIQHMNEVLPVHRTALALLQAKNHFLNIAGADWDAEVAESLQQRFADFPESVQWRALQTYAAPLLTQKTSM